jgi:hypothetical protein
MSNWREEFADQNLRMAAKMLDQQREVNEAKAQVAALIAERDAAETRGYARAVAALRDGERVRAWTHSQPDLVWNELGPFTRRIAADYLEETADVR